VSPYSRPGILHIVEPAETEEESASVASLIPGAGRLRFASVGGRTVLTRALAVSPLKMLNPANAGTSAWAYLATYGGGLVGGDALDIEIGVDHRATALVATQASTKVYRSEQRASQFLRAHIAAEGALVLLPDPVTCFAGARYFQEQHVRMAQAANLVLVDRLTAGRIGSGERWRFDEYVSRTQIWRGDRLLVHDALHLTPGEGDLACRMDRFNCLATIMVIGPRLRATALHLAGALGSAPVPRRAELLLSAAPVDTDGVLVRLAGESVEQVSALVRQHLSAVTAILGDDPWSRKW